MKSRACLVALLVLGAILLAACPNPKPTPTPGKNTPSPQPTAEGWGINETSDLTISLPKDWEVLKIGKGDLQSLFAQFQKQNPLFAAAIGSAENLDGVSLWAFNQAAGSDGYPSNLSVRRVSLAGQKPNSTQEIMDQVLSQYRQLGITVGESTANLTISQHPAARISYIFPLAGADGKPLSADGQQYLVLTATDLWVLTYTATADQSAALAPVIERSAQSFKVK